MANTVLNLGSGSHDIMGKHYEGWNVVSMDLDPDSGADIIADARLLSRQRAYEYDAILLSHVLEHFYEWDNKGVLEGMRHVLKPDGFVEIYVPDILGVSKLERVRGLSSIVYYSGAGSITFHQMLYGYGNNEFMAHKQGFDQHKLSDIVRSVFPHIMRAKRHKYEIGLFAATSPEALWQLLDEE